MFLFSHKKSYLFPSANSEFLKQSLTSCLCQQICRWWQKSLLHSWLEYKTLYSKITNVFQKFIYYTNMIPNIIK